MPTNGGDPDLATISSFFGAEKQDDGSYTFNNQEKIPDDWYNRETPYTIAGVTEEILALYLEYPVLFGGNTGDGQFDALDFQAIKGGKLSAPDASSIACLLYQLATENVPASLSGVLELPLQIVSYAAGKLNPVFEDFGCPLKSN